MHKRTTLACLALTATLLVPLGACGARAQSVPESTASAPTELPKTTANTDPRKGWVVVQRRDKQDGVYIPEVTKKCDGTTLVYFSWLYTDGPGGIAVIANSPECAPQ